MTEVITLCSKVKRQVLWSPLSTNLPYFLQLGKIGHSLNIRTIKLFSQCFFSTILSPIIVASDLLRASKRQGFGLGWAKEIRQSRRNRVYVGKVRSLRFYEPTA